MSDREYMDSTSKALSIDKDSQINVVVNRSGEADNAIDLMHVFHNMKIKTRIYAWVVILCMVIGLCAPLLLYQFRVGTTRVSSVVTLNYYLQNGKLVQLSDVFSSDYLPHNTSLICLLYFTKNNKLLIHIVKFVTIDWVKVKIKVKKLILSACSYNRSIRSKDGVPRRVRLKFGISHFLF